MGSKKKNKEVKEKLPSFLGMSFLSKNFRFLLFMGFLGLLYISNVHSTQKKMRAINEINKEITKLRNQSIAANCELVKKSKQSSLLTALAPKGFSAKYKKPEKITVR